FEFTPAAAARKFGSLPAQDRSFGRTEPVRASRRINTSIRFPVSSAPVRVWIAASFPSGVLFVRFIGLGKMPRYTRLVLLATSLVLPATGAPASANHYGLTISTGTTSNVSFNNGVFTATGDRANLNVNDLENALSAGNVEVTTD